MCSEIRMATIEVVAAALLDDDTRKNEDEQDDKLLEENSITTKKFTENSTTFKSLDDEEIKHPKKKVAIIMGYKGTDYQGMQANPNAKSIESVLFKAFYDAGFVSDENAKDQTKVEILFHSLKVLYFSCLDRFNASL